MPDVTLGPNAVLWDLLPVKSVFLYPAHPSRDAVLRGNVYGDSALPVSAPPAATASAILVTPLRPYRALIVR